MEVLKTKNYRESGLTLIEVLIALAVIAIALTAVIKATSQNIRGTNYLHDKTMATWVGQQVLNGARVKLINLPNAPDHLKGETGMFSTIWYWRASQETTPNRHINKMSVEVFANPDDEDNPIVSIESYVLFEE